jgi:hypothetical protein
MLVIVTFGALVLAGAAAFYLLRVTRQERERSEARAAALADALGTTAAPGVAPAAYERVETGEHAARPMFGEAPAVDGAVSRRWLVPAIGALVVGAVLTGVYAWNRPADAVEATVDARPLELLALTHQRQGDSLVVSGLVRNPAAGRPLAGLTAVAFTFNRQGTFLTSGRAMVNFPRLGAGDESPFSVTLPQAADVSRYRVSFRTEAGVVAHVDRREPAVSVTPASTEVRR